VRCCNTPRIPRKEKDILTKQQAHTLLEEVRAHRLEALSVSYLKGYGYVESEPKTAKGRRMIKLPVFVVDILKRHKAQQEEQRHQVGSAWIDKDLVFTNAQGYYFSSSTLRKVFRRFLISIGLPHMRFHDLRHSAATILLAIKVHPKVVQEILGHSQITITLNVYSHALPSMQKDVTKQWDSEFGKPVKKRNRESSCYSVATFFSNVEIEGRSERTNKTR